MTSPDLIAPEDGFLGLSGEYLHGSGPVARIIPFGLENTVSYGAGTSRGPKAMIDASHEVELFDDELWCEPIRSFQVQTLDESAISENQDEALGQLEAMMEQALNDGVFPLVFGGEHGLTPGGIRPFLKRYEHLTFLHVDAHADLRDGYGGHHYSHASALRRVLDHDNVTVHSFGIRNISASEIPFFEANRGKKITINWARDRQRWNWDEIAQYFRGKDIFVTIDLDGFDASIMPATGTPEPGGLFWDDVTRLLRTAAQVGNFVGGDIVELAPIPGWHATDFMAAKLAYKLLGYHFCKDRLTTGNRAA